MTDQEINVAVAVACGKPVCIHSPDKWERRGTDGDSELYCTGCQRYLHDMRVPKFCADLNAMHEAERTCLTTEELQDRFTEELLRVVVSPAEVEYGCFPITVKMKNWWLCHNYARQRAEAFLRTLGKWKDGGATR